MTNHPAHIYRQVAQLHIQNLDQGFLGTLGETFLAELYRAIDNSDSSTLIIEMYEGEAVGFVTGGRGMGPIYKTMFGRIYIWAMPLGLRLLSVKRVKRIFDIIRYGDDGMPDNVPTEELYSIAVSSKMRGKGVAPKLYAHLIDYFRSENVDQFRIIVGRALAPAHGFYKKMGAVIAAETEIHAGEPSMVYIHTIRRAK